MRNAINVTADGWVRSSYSGPEGGQCVEWAPGAVAHGVVPVRDSKDPEGPVLAVSPGAWAAFVAFAARSDA
ncbi:DUF397 domain-containing protein [Streptomyces varsoviensis]|uniref:DUF397 domain-containing protein n=1 Tax=Streptomyces varsoviensis TaxID=67373 RepID=UPI00099782FC|nr:DUF397 domain-containing protein [Streptomyces varsoviensis]